MHEPKATMTATRRAGLAALALLLGTATAIAAEPDRISQENAQRGAKDKPLYGGPGGGGFRDQCGHDQFLTGFSASTGTLFDAIVPLCGKFNPATGLIGAPGVPGDRHGGKGGGAKPPVTCEPNQYVSSIVFGYTTDSRGLAKYIASVWFTCSPIKPGGPTSQLRIDSAGGRVAHGGYSCGDGRAVIGVHGRSGIYVDALGAICGAKPVPFSPAAGSASRPTRSFCSQYAMRAVRAGRSNAAMGCGGTGARWTATLQQHMGWCMAQPSTDAANAESKARSQALDSCQRKNKELGKK